MVGKIMAFRKNRAARKILEFCRHWRDKMHKRTRASKRISKFVKGSAIAVTDINKVRLDLSADKVKKFLRDYAEFKTVQMHPPPVQHRCLPLQMPEMA